MQVLDSFKQNTYLNNEDKNNNISLSQRADWENKLDAQMLQQCIPGSSKEFSKQNNYIYNIF